jgi:anaerobic selenocysteine-containing dehydrogenase
MHPDTAKKHGIKEGDWVYVETRRGKIKQKAKLTEDILPNVINAEASWWFPEKEGKLPGLSGAFESNANMLTIDDPETLDPLTGGWCNRALLCKIYKAEEQSS